MAKIDCYCCPDFDEEDSFALELNQMEGGPDSAVGAAAEAAQLAIAVEDAGSPDPFVLRPLLIEDGNGSPEQAALDETLSPPIDLSADRTFELGVHQLEEAGSQLASPAVEDACEAPEPLESFGTTLLGEKCLPAEEVDTASGRPSYPSSIKETEVRGGKARRSRKSRSGSATATKLHTKAKP